MHVNNLDVRPADRCRSEFIKDLLRNILKTLFEKNNLGLSSKKKN